MEGAEEVGVVSAKEEARRCSATSATATAKEGTRGLGGAHSILVCQLAIHKGVTAKCGGRTGGECGGYWGGVQGGFDFLVGGAAEVGARRSEYTRITVLYALRSLQGSFIAWS